jgi:ribosomal protein S12 methylthiotransferase
VKKQVYFVSLGCPKNRVDTEVMLGLAEGDGYQIASSPEQAEVIVVNTCGFIGEAKEESVDTILEMARHKEAGTCQRLVVTGCLSQRYAGELERDLPEIDHLLGSGDVDRIGAAIRGEAPRVGVSSAPAWLYDHATPRVQSLPGYTAYVKIAEGCDRPCSFCIIPQLRGGQRSRSADSVEREVRALVEGGASEINLVAQDLTTYGQDLDGAADLAQLVRRLARTDGLRWLRLHYAYPSATTDALIDAIADEPRVAKYVDMPLQHIDDQLLRIMRRGYSARAAREVLAKVRARIPGVTLRTTFIVGHPGETEEAFQRLKDFVIECEFDRVGVFTYSLEEGTHAATLPGRVPGRTAERRRKELMRAQRAISKRKMQARVGSQLEVLVEGPSDESEYVLAGRHEGQAPEIDGAVYLTLPDGAPAPAAGDLVRAEVTGFADYDLAATVREVIAPSRVRRSVRRLPVIAA